VQSAFLIEHREKNAANYLEDWTACKEARSSRAQSARSAYTAELYVV